MLVVVILTIASFGFWIVGSGTLSTRTSCLPCHVTAFILPSPLARRLPRRFKAAWNVYGFAAADLASRRLKAESLLRASGQVLVFDLGELDLLRPYLRDEYGYLATLLLAGHCYLLLSSLFATC